MVETIDRSAIKSQEPIETTVPEQLGTVLFGDEEIHNYLGTETGSLRTYSGKVEEVACDSTGCNVTLFEETGRKVTRKLPTNGEDLEPTLTELIGGEAFGSSTVFGNEFVLLSVNRPAQTVSNEPNNPQALAAD